MFCPNCGSNLNGTPRFCTECGSEITVQAIPPIQNASPVSSTDTPIQCPSCGTPLSSFDAICPACGTENIHSGQSTALQGFAEQIKRIEEKLKDTPPLFDIHPAYIEMASCIKLFSIPNSKTDILDFMVMAATNIDAKILGENAEYTFELRGKLMVAKAWYSQFEQAYNKAMLSLSGDHTVQRIKDIYEKKKKEIEEYSNAKKTNEKSSQRTIVVGCGSIIVFLLCILIGGMVRNALLTRKLEKKMEEIQVDIANGDYDSALTKANTLRFYDGGDGGQREKYWNEQRESIIAVIENRKQEAKKESETKTDSTTKRPIQQSSTTTKTEAMPKELPSSEKERLSYYNTETNFDFSVGSMIFSIPNNWTLNEKTSKDNSWLFRDDGDGIKTGQLSFYLIDDWDKMSIEEFDAQKKDFFPSYFEAIVGTFNQDVIYNDSLQLDGRHGIYGAVSGDLKKSDGNKTPVDCYATLIYDHETGYCISIGLIELTSSSTTYWNDYNDIITNAKFTNDID